MTDQRLKRVQASSGLVFAAFLLVHLVNQAIAAAGAATYDLVQKRARAVYQVPLLELVVVLLPLLVHLGCAVTAMVRRRGASAAVPAWPLRLHRWTGRFLLLVILGHVGATRLPALYADAPPFFAGVAFTFKWIPLWFWPYYPALALAGWYHFLSGLGLALPTLGVRGAGRLLAPRVLGLTFAVGAIALLAGVVAFGTAEASVMQSPYARFWLGPE